MTDSPDAGAPLLPDAGSAEARDPSVTRPVGPATPAGNSAKPRKTAVPAVARRSGMVGPLLTNVAVGEASLTAVPLTPREWWQRIFQGSWGFLVSLLVHALILLPLAFVMLPQDVREDLLNTLIVTTESAVEGDGGGDEGLDDTTLITPNVTDLEPSAPVQTDSRVVSENSTPADVEPVDITPQLDLPGPLPAGEGGGPHVANGDLNGRSQQARGSLLASQGGTPASEAAVDRGLKWLARHQRRDGSWSFQHGEDDPGSIDNPMGATGLALLAFLGGGHTTNEGDYQLQVSRGIRYLISHMKETPTGGDLRVEGDSYGMYSQGICTIALCEAYVLSNDRALKFPAQAAVNFIVNAQHSKGGWRYYPGQKGDTSVVGWQVMALKSAKFAKLDIPQKAMTKSMAFLTSVQKERGAKYGYDNAHSGGIATTSVGLLCRMYLGWTPKNAGLVNGVAFLDATGPQPQNIYFDYYATQVMHHWGGEPWKKWNNVMREYLIKNQEQAGDAAGSWKPVGTEVGETVGGRHYRTCLSIMTLEVYYRHLPLYQREALKAGL